MTTLDALRLALDLLSPKYDGQRDGDAFNRKLDELRAVAAKAGRS